MKIRKPNCIKCEALLIEGTNWRRTTMTRTCSFCLSKDRREYYLQNKEHLNTVRKSYRSEAPNIVMYTRVKGRAKKEGLPFNLELSDIVIQERCPVFGTPYVIGKNSPSNPSLDRIVPSKGYVKGNVIVMSKRANSIKNDATPEELYQVASFVETLLENVDELLVSRYE